MLQVLWCMNHLLYSVFIRGKAVCVFNHLLCTLEEGTQVVKALSIESNKSIYTNNFMICIKCFCWWRSYLLIPEPHKWGLAFMGLERCSIFSVFWNYAPHIHLKKKRISVLFKVNILLEHISYPRTKHINLFHESFY